MSLVWALRRGEVWLTPPGGERAGLRWSLARQLRRWRRRITGSLVGFELMRLVKIPAKSIEHIPQPQPVTVAVVSYIPFLSGYYAEGLDVLKACLESLWQNTAEGYDLLVFDNASCAEVRRLPDGRSPARAHPVPGALG